MVEEGAGGSYKGDENALDDEEEWSGIQDPVFTDEAGQSGPSSTVALDIGGEAEEAEEDDEMVDDDEEVDDLSEEVDSDGPNEEGVIEPEPDFDGTYLCLSLLQILSFPQMIFCLSGKPFPYTLPSSVPFSRSDLRNLRRYRGGLCHSL